MEPESTDQELRLQDPFFPPLPILGSATRDLRFICGVMGEVLKLKWLKNKTHEEMKAMLALLMPSLACNCVENNDFISLQEIVVKMDVNAGDYDAHTAMHRACEKGKTGMVKYLLSNGATTQVQNGFGCTPLYLAIKNKHFDSIRFLGPKEAAVTLKPVRIGMDLIKAVETKDYQLLRAWYMAGTNMNQSDYNGQTALHAAVKRGDTNMVAKLLEYGARHQIKDVWGSTAADEARKRNLHDILVLFDSSFPV